jgi:ribose transport system permease protein
MDQTTQQKAGQDGTQPRTGGAHAATDVPVGPDAETTPTTVGTTSSAPAADSTARRVLKWLSPKNISAIYVGVAILILFGLWIPDLFLTEITWRTLLNNNAIAALASLALILPLAAGVINLAIGTQVGAASIFVGWLLVKQGWSIPQALAICLVMGAIIGLVTGWLVVYARIESFIATLGVSSLLAAFIAGISSGRQILGMPPEFANLGTGTFLSITYPVYVLLGVAVLLWYYLERTSAGRRMYAVGGNIEAARLSGVRVNRVIITSLVLCGIVGALAGVLLTARLANADPSIGPAYLLPTFTAAFLGSTQFGGRFNVWGTVISLYVLAAGVKGLQLAGAPVWIPDAFNGAALLIAVALAKYQSAQGRSSAISRIINRRRAAATPAQTSTAGATRRD